MILKDYYTQNALWQNHVGHDAKHYGSPTFRPTFRRNQRVILHPAAEFRPNRNIRRWNMTSYRFSRWRPSAMLYLLWGNGGPPTKCLSCHGLNSVLKSLLRRINSSGDNAIVTCSKDSPKTRLTYLLYCTVYFPVLLLGLFFRWCICCYLWFPPRVFFPVAVFQGQW